MAQPSITASLDPVEVTDRIKARGSISAAARSYGIAQSTLSDYVHRMKLSGWESVSGPVAPPADPSEDFVEIPVIYRDYSDRDELFVYPMGDVHLGSEAHDSERWEEWLGFIASRENTSFLGIGDFLNSALKTSVSECYDEVMTVGKAKRKLRKQLEVVRDKIDLLMPGNHEARIYRAVGDCPIEDIADSLEVSYAKDSALVVYKVGEVEYRFYVRHGTGGGGVGARANRMEKQAQVYSADVYVSGHVHNVLTFANEVFVYNPVSRKSERHRRYFVSSGSFLRYEAYAAASAFAPSKLGAPRIFLSGRNRDVHVSI